MKLTAVDVFIIATILISIGLRAEARKKPGFNKDDDEKKLICYVCSGKDCPKTFSTFSSPKAYCEKGELCWIGKKDDVIARGCASKDCFKNDRFSSNICCTNNYCNSSRSLNRNNRLSDGLVFSLLLSLLFYFFKY